MKILIYALLSFIAGCFLTAYLFIPRFRTGFHHAIIAALNGLDKLLSSRKKQPPEAKK